MCLTNTNLESYKFLFNRLKLTEMNFLNIQFTYSNRCLLFVLSHKKY